MSLSEIIASELNGTDFANFLINDSCSILSCPILSSGVWFMLQSILLLLTSIAAIPWNLIVLDVLRTTSCIHPNVGLLLMNVAIANILTSLHYIGQSIYNFVFFVEIFENSDLDSWHVTTHRECALFQILSGITVYCLFFSMTGIVVERLLALTFRKASMLIDRDTSEVGVRIFAVGCWLAGLGIMLSGQFHSSSENSSTCVCYCHSTLVLTSTMFYFSLVVSLSTEFLSTVLCLVVRRLSRSILASAHSVGVPTIGGGTNGGGGGTGAPQMNSLTERYQLNRTVKTMSMLYPSLISHCTFYILALALRVPSRTWLSYFKGASDLETNNLQAGAAIHLLLLNMQCVCAACCLHPLLIVRNNPMLAKALSERWPKSGRFLFGVTVQTASVQAALSTSKNLNKQLQSSPRMNRGEGGAGGGGASNYHATAGAEEDRGGMWREFRVGRKKSKDDAWVSRSGASPRSSRASKPSVQFIQNQNMVTEYRLAAGAHEQVWENFWKR